MAYRFISIHGTFSASARWVYETPEENPDGFRARLITAFGSAITFSIPPAWGSTSWAKKWFDLTNAARLNGAIRLKQHILSQPRQANEKTFSLAHSHGGNIALYALQDPAVRNAIDGVICMATPFLFPRVRPLSISILSMSLVIMALGVAELTLRILPSGASWLNWAVAVGLLITTVLIPGVLIWVVASQRFKRKIRNDRKLEQHIESLSYADPHLPILLIRASGDEASGLLRSMQFLNWLGAKVMRASGRYIYALICIALLTLVVSSYAGLAILPDKAFSLLAIALVLSALIIVVMLMVLTVSRVAVGLDAWRWVGEIETMIEDGPPGIKSELMVIKPRHPKSGLSHTAVYSEPETTQAIADWCRKQ